MPAAAVRRTVALEPTWDGSVCIQMGQDVSDVLGFENLIEPLGHQREPRACERLEVAAQQSLANASGTCERDAVGAFACQDAGQFIPGARLRDVVEVAVFHSTVGVENGDEHALRRTVDNRC